MNAGNAYFTDAGVLMSHCPLLIRARLKAFILAFRKRAVALEISYVM